MTFKDRIGNAIKPGQHVSVTLVEHAIICEVLEVNEPSMLSVGKDPMLVPGTLVLVSKHIIPLHPQVPNLTALVVCQTPPELKDGKPN